MEEGVTGGKPAKIPLLSAARGGLKRLAACGANMNGAKRHPHPVGSPSSDSSGGMSVVDRTSSLHHPTKPPLGGWDREARGPRFVESFLVANTAFALGRV